MLDLIITRVSESTVSDDHVIVECDGISDHFSITFKLQQADDV